MCSICFHGEHIQSPNFTLYNVCTFITLFGITSQHHFLCTASRFKFNYLSARKCSPDTLEILQMQNTCTILYADKCPTSAPPRARWLAKLVYNKTPLDLFETEAVEKNPRNAFKVIQGHSRSFKVIEFLIELVFAVLHHEPTGLGAIHGEA